MGRISFFAFLVFSFLFVSLWPAPAFHQGMRQCANKALLAVLLPPRTVAKPSIKGVIVLGSYRLPYL